MNNNTDMNNQDMFLDWDDSIENDGQEFVILPEGDYNFTVTDFERGRFPGSVKIPACNKASLTLRVDTDDGVAFVKTDLLLYRSLEWKISSFFRAIGQKKHGERLVMDWNKVLGAQGRAHFKPRNYTASDGSERTTNDCDRFIDYDPANFPEKDAWLEVEDDIPFE